MLNVNHRFARANQEKISENILYCTTNVSEGTRNQQRMTHKGLNVKEEHADDTMARLVKSEEVHHSILESQLSDYITGLSITLTMDAANEPFSHRRR